MNKKDLIQNSGILFLALALGACGSSGGGTSNPQNGDALKLNVTALNNKTVVAAAPKSKLDTMLAFLGSKEAVAAVDPNACNPTDPTAFFLSGGADFVCLTEALLVYEEIELEKEGAPNSDEAESGPYLIDMIGTANDGIPGSISLKVPDGSFNKLELKVGDLDDALNDGLDDSPSSSGDDDDTPVNVSLDIANAAKMANKSLKISGTAYDNAGNSQLFTFFSNIEAKLEMPISLGAGDPLVVDGSTLVTFVNLSVGFGNLLFSDFPTVGDMNGSFANNATCSTVGTTNKAQQLACDSVKNVELYHDDDNDDSFDDSERRGGGKGKNGFNDDSGNKD